MPGKILRKLYTVLVIEDDLTARFPLVSALKAEGFTVQEAGDGESGLEMARSIHPDLITLDLVLPKMHGMDVLRRIRSEEWGKDTPIFIITALSDREIVQEAAKEGSKNFIVKKEWPLDAVVQEIRTQLGEG